MKKLILLALIVAGCTPAHRQAPPVPRPRAYPRVEAYPAAYSPLRVGRIVLMVNDSARCAVDGLWADLVYPAYGVTVNCTVTPVTEATVGGVLDNRSERMALNAGSSYGEITRLTSDSGAGATLLQSHGGGLTPLQFLATDSATYVLSGAATLGVTAPADSLRPVIDAVKSDLIYLLQKL